MWLNLMMIYKKIFNEVQVVEISVENLCIDLKKINRFDDEIEFLKQNVKIIVETKKYIVLWFMARTKNRCRMVMWICLLKIKKTRCDHMEILKKICHVKRLKDMIRMYFKYVCILRNTHTYMYVCVCVCVCVCIQCVIYVWYIHTYIRYRYIYIYYNTQTYTHTHTHTHT